MTVQIRGQQASGQGSLQLKVGLKFSSSCLTFYIKNIATLLIIFFTMWIYLYLSESQKVQQKKKCCLVLPGYTQKAKKAMDSLLKKTIAKFSSKSARFKKLALDTNICIVLENERNFKKLFVKTKIIWIKNTFALLGDRGKNTLFNILVLNKKVEHTCTRRHRQP